MKNELLFIILLLSNQALSQDKSCVNELASAPYCFTIATSEMICKDYAPIVEDTKTCVRENIESYGRSPEARALVSSMCLAGSATSSDESKNKSLCQDSHFQSEQENIVPSNSVGAQ
jgi:hypothetical protein